MKFFNIDLHISVIADMKAIFNELGHQVDDLSLSDHTWVFNRPKDSVPMLDNARWTRITASQMADEFYDHYKNSLDKYDAFIVTYPPPFALLYKKFNKPIIINIPIRYECPFSFREHDWEYFNEFLIEGVRSNQVILVANNIVDQKYTESFIDVEVKHIPSICDYFPEKYSPKMENFLYYSKNRVNKLNNTKIKYKSDLLGKHKYSDLVEHKGIVHFPYTCSYMSVFEQYSSNIPLFFPSQDFLLELYFSNDYNVFSEISFYKMHNHFPKSIVKNKSNLDFNNFNDRSIIQLLVAHSDFYDQNWMPHIQFFNSIEHLIELTDSSDLNNISNNMAQFNIFRRNKIKSMWNELINGIKL